MFDSVEQDLWSLVYDLYLYQDSKGPNKKKSHLIVAMHINIEHILFVRIFVSCYTVEILLKLPNIFIYYDFRCDNCG